MVLALTRSGGNADEAVRRIGRLVSRACPSDVTRQLFICPGATLTLDHVDKIELTWVR